MANFARGLASGLESGYKLGEMLRQKNERERLQEIMQAAPQTLQGYGPEQATQLQAIQNASYVNEAGERVPYYNVSATPSDNGLGGYEVRPNLKATYKGEDGEAKPYFGGLGYESPTGLTTPQRFAPGPVTSFLGQRYGAEGPTQQQMEQARYKSMADVLAETNPAEGLRMRQQMLAEQRAAGAEQRAIAGEERTAQLFPGQLAAQKTQQEAGELGLATLKETAEQRAAKKEIDTKYTDFLKNSKEPTPELKTVAALQYRAGKLLEAGLVDDSIATTNQHISLANQLVERDTRARNEKIPGVLNSLASGDTKPAIDFYHKFVPDGANVKDIKREKDGSYTITRETADGRALSPTKLKDLQEIVAAVDSFRDPSVLGAYIKGEITNNFQERQLKVSERSQASQESYQNKALGIKERELGRPTSSSIIPLVNKEGKQILYDIINNKEIKLPEGYQPAKVDTSLNKKDKDILDDAQKDRKWERATMDERAKMIRDRGGDPEKIIGTKGRPNLYEEE